MPDSLAELRSLLAESSPPPMAHSPLDELRSLVSAPSALKVDANPTPDELEVIAGAPPHRPAPFSLKPAKPPLPVESQPGPPARLGSAKTGGGASAIPGTFPVLDAPAEGIPQFGRGAKHLMTGEGGRMNAASDLIEGAMKTSEPAMVATALVNPLATLAGLVGGVGGQQAAAAGAEALGASPEATRLAGNVGGLAVGGAAAHGAGVGKARVMEALRPPVAVDTPLEATSPEANPPSSPLKAASPEPQAPSPIEELQQLVDPREQPVATEGVTPPPPVLDPEAQAIRDQTANPVIDRMQEKMATGEQLGTPEARAAFEERQRVEAVRKASPIDELRDLVGEKEDALPIQRADESSVQRGIGLGDEGTREDLGARDAEHQESPDARPETETPVGAEAAEAPAAEDADVERDEAAPAEDLNPVEELQALVGESDLFKSEKPKFGEWQKTQAPRGDVTLQSTLVPGAKEFAEQDLEPIARGVTDIAREAKGGLSPQTASPAAQESADVVRYAKARIANANAIEESKYSKIAKGFAKSSDAQNIANIAAYERTGQFEHAPAGYSELYTKSMTQAGKLLNAAYGRNIAGRVENYVRRAFVFGTKADEQKGVDYLTNKMYSLSANKSPTKARVLDMPLDEALANMKARGIVVKPVTTNPELLRQWSIGNARQAMAYRDAWDDLADRRLIRYVASFTKPPKGMVPLEDRVATKFKSPLIDVKEARDAGVMEGLRDVAEGLGVKLERKVNIGGPRSAGGGTVWGYSIQGGDKVVTKFAGSESILAHEIGHQIDHKFGLWNKLKGLEKQYKGEGYENWSLQKQLRAVTDLTWEGQEVPSETYQRYNRGKDEKIANLISAYVHAQEKLKKVAPDVFNVLDELVDTTPQLAGLREIKPGIRLEPGGGQVHAGGHVIAGQYYADPTVARVLNNAVSRGLENSPTYRGLRAINSAMNQLQLGLSGFHATGTAINAGISDLALGIRKIGRGDLAGGASSVSRSLVPGLSFARDLFKGDQLIRGLKDNNPEAYKVLTEKVNPSGARLHIEERYQNRAYENMRTAFANSNYVGAAARLPLAVVEQTAKPLMSYAIPRVKIGALLDMLHDIDDRMPNAAPEEKARAYAAASDSIDNRFGQLVHDNLFWNKTASDLSQLATRSVGWNLGTVREIGGGLADTRKLAHGEVTDRLLYTAALPVYVGLIGAVYQYLHTGEKPSEVKDYFYPKNGRTEPNGMVSRTTLPTYMKDVEAYASHPIDTIGHKQSPLLDFAGALVKNEDYFGNLIRNPDDPASKQAQQLGAYTLREIAPFSVQQLQRSSAEKATTEGKAESFLGFVKAPASMERTPAEALMHDFIGPQPGRTPEQVEQSGVKRELRQDIKEGNTAGARAIIDKGQVGRRSIMDAARSAHYTGIQAGFRKLTLDQALKVYEVATPEQRGALRTLLTRKVTALRDAAPEDLPELQKRLLKAGQLPFSPPPIMAALQPPQPAPR